MGMCGCISSANVPGARFAGPDGSWYVIEYYTGCDYCMEMPGIMLSHYEPGDAMFDVMELPIIKPGPMYLLPTSDVEKIKNKIGQLDEDDCSLTEWSAEDLIQFHQSIAHELALAWKKPSTKPREYAQYQRAEW